MSQVKTKIEIIKETYEYYKADPKRRGINEAGRCVYLAENGNKCAAGRCLDFDNNTDYILDNEGTGICCLMGVGYKKLEIFKPEYRIGDHNFWRDLQAFHDSAVYWNEKSITKEGEERYQSLLKEYKGQ
jgi:hypothetical protein